jgi:ATP-binding cassette, subfamily A (ABC1), member 3
MTPIFYFIP